MLLVLRLVIRLSMRKNHQWALRPENASVQNRPTVLSNEDESATTAWARTSGNAPAHRGVSGGYVTIRLRLGASIRSRWFRWLAPSTKAGSDPAGCGD